MKLSIKSDYAARAVLCLSRHYADQTPLRLEDLATEEGIPSKYLIQILIELKSKQIVKSQRGKEGGYLLARPPGKITLGDVLRCVHGSVFDSPALSEANCPSELKRAWHRLQKALDETADAINFQELVEQGAAKEKMYYI